MNLVLFGAPGSGKGTQAERLRDKFSLKHISTGDLLRDAVAQRTALGKQVERVLAAGELVSDDLVLEFMKKAIVAVLADNSSTGWILDGYPRTLTQAKELDGLLGREGGKIGAVVVLDVDRDAIIGRLSARRVCLDCKAVYSMRVNPPMEDGRCDKCGGTVVQRKDDQPETIANRLDVYEERTKPILGHYQGRVAIHRIDGNRPVDEVARDIERIVQ